MVLTSDIYSGHGYKQPSYMVVQEGYGYSQNGHGYNTPMGTGYNSVPLSHHQCHQQPVDDFYSRPHGHGYDHNQSHAHKYQHQSQHGLTTYSAGEMAIWGSQCPPMGYGYGPSYANGPGKYGKIYSAFKEADD